MVSATHDVSPPRGPVPDLDLETRRMEIAGVVLLREYALFVAVPVSVLGYLLGRVLGRCS